MDNLEVHSKNSYKYNNKSVDDVDQHQVNRKERVNKILNKFSNGNFIFFLRQKFLRV